MIYNNEYAKAYVELYEIIKTLPSQEKNRIPKDFIDFLKENMDSNYTFIYDNEKSLQEQNIKVETRALLVKVYEKFLSKPEEKDFWDKYDKECMIISENNKKQLYNSDDLFKNKNKIESIKQDNTNEATLIEHKESLFKKIKNYILKIFHKNT